MVSLTWKRQGNEIKVSPFLINDLHSSFKNCKLMYKLQDGHGKIFDKQEVLIKKIPENSISRLKKRSFRLNPENDVRPLYLKIKLEHNGEMLSSNSYNFSLTNPFEIPQFLIRLIGRVFLPIAFDNLLLKLNSPSLMS
ncbi:MAG: hypothetical protein ACTSSI_18360 [Candidatus Helarchaeota archaeon]